MSKDTIYDFYLEKLKQIHEDKEKDYTGQFSPEFNFRFAEEFASNFGSKVDKPYAYLIGVKIARLIVLLNQALARPRCEPIEDTFLDIANYFLLWASRRAGTLKYE